MGLRTLLHELLQTREYERLEFKEAKNDFDSERLTKYCIALANEGGGTLVLGVSDKIPRTIVGTKAFPSLGKACAQLLDRLHLRIEAEEITEPQGRVLMFRIPSRPIGLPLQHNGAYWMRSGEQLVPMTPEQLRRIFAEAGPDFSAESCPQATLVDLDPTAIGIFREKWARKTKNLSLLKLSDEQLLSDAELLVDGSPTYAALILFGTRKALGKFLAQTEIIFEYRSTEASLSAHQRKEYREGFFLVDDDLWNTINLRNDIQQYRDGLFMQDIPTFNEDVVRELVLNAVCHRDYRNGGSTFVRQYPRRMEIVSPGGFPPGITPENVLWKQFPRNRRLAEAFAKCGLVERSGQGMDRVFGACIKESKSNPDFTGTDDYQVSVILRCEVQDVQFLRFLEQVGQERLESFSANDFLLLDAIHRERPVTQQLKEHLSHLLDSGVIENSGRGKYILSRRFYGFLGKKGVYTRKKGLDRETNKALLLKHIHDNQKEGSKLEELLQVLPACSLGQVQKFLQSLKKEGRICKTGNTSSSRWFPSKSPD
jgi:ATP-dependent DNA helicase RecG